MFSRLFSVSQWGHLCDDKWCCERMVEKILKHIWLCRKMIFNFILPLYDYLLRFLLTAIRYLLNTDFIRPMHCWFVLLLVHFCFRGCCIAFCCVETGKGCCYLFATRGIIRLYKVITPANQAKQELLITILSFSSDRKRKQTALNKLLVQLQCKSRVERRQPCTK